MKNEKMKKQNGNNFSLEGLPPLTPPRPDGRGGGGVVDSDYKPQMD